MAGFDNPRETWNTRYAIRDYLFGESPNAFLQRQAHWLPHGGSVLCVADGEGRNSVWLAEQGFDVTAFDFAENAVVKARALAKRRNVQVGHGVADMAQWTWAEDAYDALVAIFIQFLPPETRDAMFERMKAVVRPGGVFLLEGYRPEQVDYKTGGPPRREHMYTRAWLEARFTGWKIELLEEYDTEIREGTAHGGMSALIDLVARKPVR
jgi:2-polyprenyl-3-methyl-5-hydroxy-6-metoxy-1,4-benzoquinol methylase